MRPPLHRIESAFLALSLLAVPLPLLAQSSTDPSLVFDKVEAMVPVRDGVRLQTEIYVPKGVREKLPFLKELHNQGWATSLVIDQRFVQGRPDVLTWETEPLSQDVVVAGNITAHLFASTTGSDADFAVKLIDVWPEHVPGDPIMGGYHAMVAGEILRGRFRKSFEKPEPFSPGKVEEVAVDLLSRSHVFSKGHRILVEVHSTWFSLYDRNPQTFVPNIFEAKESDFQAQTHRIHRSKRYPSRVVFDSIAP